MSHLREVGTLGRPHGSSTHAKNDGGWDQGVELRVEHGSDVGGVGKDANNQSPLNFQLLDEDAWHKHTRDDQTGIHSGICPVTKVVNLQSNSLFYQKPNNYYMFIFK